MRIKIDIDNKSASALKIYTSAVASEVYRTEPIYSGVYTPVWSYTGSTSISGQYFGIEVTFSDGEIQRSPVAVMHEQKITSMGPYAEGMVGSIWAGTMPMPAGSTVSAQTLVDRYNALGGDQLKLVDDQPSRPLTRVFIDGVCYAIKHGAYLTGVDGALVNNLFTIVNALRTIEQVEQGYKYTPILATNSMVAGKFGHLFNDRAYSFKGKAGGADTEVVNLVKTLSNGTNSWTGTTLGKMITNDAGTSITGVYFTAAGVSTTVYTHNYNCMIPVIFAVSKA